MALHLLTVFPENRTDSVLLVRYLKHLKLDCIELAVECGCEKFVSSINIQNVLENIWSGKLGDSNYLVSVSKKILNNCF